MAYSNLIAGGWRESNNTVANINPSDTSDVIGDYAQASLKDVAEASASAKEAALTWRKSTPQQRFDVLDFIGTELLARKAEIGEILAREEGKTLPEGIGETARAGQVFKFFAGEALRLTGELGASVRPGVKVEITREPVGVVAAITPWNFPIAIPAWKVAPALCHGNAVILKPAELTPACAWVLADIISRSGLPAGVFSLLMGTGAEVGQALLDDTNIDAVTFTGSVATGSHILSCTTRRGCKAQLEMGGKNPLVVLDDADIKIAVDCALNGAFFSTGQRCTASSRLIVTPGIADKFATALTKATAELRVGDARHPETQIGPLADIKQLEKSEQYIREGVEAGATILAGGNVVKKDTDGFYLEPTLFDNVSNDISIAQEEIFGPVAVIIRAKDADDALRIANDTSFGLSGGVCTSSLAEAERFKAEMRVGMVMVNLPTAGVDYHVPFGGCKGSSFGSREQGSHALEFYTQVKTAYQFSG